MKTTPICRIAPKPWRHARLCDSPRRHAAGRSYRFLQIKDTMDSTRQIVFFNGTTAAGQEILQLLAPCLSKRFDSLVVQRSKRQVLGSGRTHGGWRQFEIVIRRRGRHGAMPLSGDRSDRGVGHRDESISHLISREIIPLPHHWQAASGRDRQCHSDKALLAGTTQNRTGPIRFILRAALHQGWVQSFVDAFQAKPFITINAAGPCATGAAVR
jgi:hypothetical protein